MTSPNVSMRSSIATRLLATVFSIYFLVTLSVTVGHMVAEFYNTQDKVLEELQNLQITFEPSLALSLWEYDQPLLTSTLKGMINVPTIVGVKIEDKQGRTKGRVGITFDDAGQPVQWSDQNTPVVVNEGVFSDLLEYAFPIQHEYRKKTKHVGKAILYSSTSIVFQKVQYGFFLILINAVIKTVALWIIFLWVSRALLGRPLKVLTDAVTELDMDNLETLKIDLPTSGQNEFKILEEAFQQMMQKLWSARDELEDRVLQRTQELQSAMAQLETQHAQLKEFTDHLEDQNTQLLASNRKLHELHGTKEQVLQGLVNLEQTSFSRLLAILQQAQKSEGEHLQECIRQVGQHIDHIQGVLHPMIALYTSEKAMSNKKVLVAENAKKQQILARMALGGTGVDLDIVGALEEGQRLLSEKNYDVVCVNRDFIELAQLAHQKCPEVECVFMTSKSILDYVNTLNEHSFLSNIVSRNDDDRTFTLKNILTTVSKLVNHDLFGSEKYLSWGVEVKQYAVTDSHTRRELTDRMEQDLEHLGIRRSIVNKCGTVAEELLMNAIYDAPVDTEGTELYNHLPRTERVQLAPEEQGKLRYACDGLLLAVSVEDPFGAFKRQTILDYLESCYTGNAGELQKEKGGAGRGLFQILNTADLVVFNVKPQVKTEVIALFNIDPSKIKYEKSPSFHYFYG